MLLSSEMVERSELTDKQLSIVQLAGSIAAGAMVSGSDLLDFQESLLRTTLQLKTHAKDLAQLQKLKIPIHIHLITGALADIVITVSMILVVCQVYFSRCTDISLMYVGSTASAV